jgi:CheY-like chemotaxis protein
VNLLIVDDHAGIRALIRDVLTPFATTVRECASGEEALTLCAQDTPDFITMDLRMPGMDGLTCVQQLRSRFPATNIAVVTHCDHDTLRARAQWAGADTYVTKDNLESLRRHLQLLTQTLSE